MEKDVKLGKLADLDFAIAGGKAKVSLAAGYELPEEGLKLASANSVELDGGVFLDKIFAMLEKISPAGLVVIEEGAKAILKEQISKL